VPSVLVPHTVVGELAGVKVMPARSRRPIRHTSCAMVR